MNSNLMLGLAVYAAPLGLCVAVFLWSRKRADRRAERGLAEARAAGLDVPPSIHPHIEPSRCLGCAVCIQACPEKGVLELLRDKAVLVTAANCVGHGACKDACPTEAIELVLGTKERGVEVPVLDATFETNLPGVFVAGELGGMGLIRNAIAQGRQVIDTVRRLDGIGEGADGERFDVVIIGAGPAGFAATLAAQEHGLRYRTLEQDALGGAVAHYPRRKLVLTAPVDLPIVGRINLRETTKEALLDLWTRVEGETEIRIEYGAKVTRIETDERGFVVTSSAGTTRCRAVVLALGRRGSPRKLGAEGEDRPKVIYMLEDPSDHCGNRVLVVGAGDSALEASIALSEQPGTEVTLSCRGDAFPRAKAPNRAKIEAAEQAGRVRVIRESTVEGVEDSAVTLSTPEGVERMGNDAVIVCVGGELPFGFLREAGVETEVKHGAP